MQEGIYHDNFEGHRHPLEAENKALLSRHAALEHTITNIKVHFDMLCTHELRQHGFVSPDHDIDFQVFRVLCGYRESMDRHAALVDAVKKERMCFSNMQYAMDNEDTALVVEWYKKYAAARAEVDLLIAEIEGEG